MMRTKTGIRSPSFVGLAPSSEASARAKRANTARDTLPELNLRRALQRLGLRYKTNCQNLPGHPDIVFQYAKVAVFCDGDFWHGRNWSQLRAKLQRRFNAPYWTAKIAANRARDKITGRSLRQLGWCVVRLWETDIKRDPDAVAFQVKRLLRDRSQR